MRVKRKWTMVLLGALLLVVLCVFAGCTQSRPAGDTNPQQSAQQQEQTQPQVQDTQAQQQAEPQNTPKTDTSNAPPEKKLPILQNATFEMGHYAWSPQAGTVETEDNGNKYMVAGYTWGLYQFLQVKPGESYQIYCKVKQGAEPASPARLSIIFYDSDHNIMEESKDFIYAPGTEWSSFPKKVFKVPENAVFTKLFLLSNGKGTVCFDNISVSLIPRETTPAASAGSQ